LSPEHRFRKAGPVPEPFSDTAASSSAPAQLLGLLVETPDVTTFLDKVVHLAAEVVTPAAACGLTVRRDGRPFTAVASNDLASRVDEIQYETDEGPCLDALRNGVVVQVDDLSQEERWDSYRPAAIAFGLLSSLSLPLIVNGESLGALNLYSPTPAAFDGPQRREAEEFAAQSQAALAVTMRHVQQADAQRQLAEAMATSRVIEQAIGILMGQQRCTASTAFDLLRKASQHRNRKLRDIAADIVAHTQT